MDVLISVCLGFGLAAAGKSEKGERGGENEYVHDEISLTSQQASGAICTAMRRLPSAR